MSFIVTSPSRYAPGTFNDQAVCPMAAQDFKELLAEHFKQKKTPYFLILIEDTTKNSALCDATQTQEWVINNFTSPVTRETCEKVYFLAVRTLDETPSRFSTCTTKEEAERAYMLLATNDSSHNTLTARKVILSSPTLTEEEYLNWADLILQDAPKDEATETAVIAFISTFITKGNPDTPGDVAKITSFVEKAARLFKHSHRIQSHLGDLHASGTRLIPQSLEKANTCYEKVLACPFLRVDEKTISLYLAKRAQIVGLLGNLQDAKEQLETALSLDSSSVFALTELTKILIFTKDLLAARGYLERAKTTAPLDPSVKKLLSELEGAEKAAAEAAWQALTSAQAPSDADFLKHVAAILQTEAQNSLVADKLIVFIDKGDKANEQDVQRALTLAKTADQTFRNNSSIQNALGKLFHSGGQVIAQDAGAALTHYKQTATLDPKHPTAFRRLGILLRNAGDYENAKKALLVAITLDPADREAHLFLADVLRSLGFFNKANDEMQIVLKLDSQEDAFMLRCYGDILRSLNELKEARDILERSLMLDEQNSFAHAVYADVLNQLEQKNDAITHYKRALEINPGNQFATAELKVLAPKKARKRRCCVIM